MKQVSSLMGITRLLLSRKQSLVHWRTQQQGRECECTSHRMTASETFTPSLQEKNLKCHQMTCKRLQPIKKILYFPTEFFPPNNQECAHSRRARGGLG